MDKRIDEIMEKVEPLQPLTWLYDHEKVRLVQLALEVPEGGTIVEIGSLYGGSTALLALGAPTATVWAHDDFSWSPIGDRPKASAVQLLENVGNLGIENVKVIQGDSRLTCKSWQRDIDLLWIDGGHSYEYVKSDLDNFGPYAKVIACHDYTNPSWESVTKAINDWLVAHPEFHIDGPVIGQVVTLRRAS